MEKVEECISSESFQRIIVYFCKARPLFHGEVHGDV
jgi:hypothetical protein